MKTSLVTTALLLILMMQSSALLFAQELDYYGKGSILTHNGPHADGYVNTPKGKDLDLLWRELESMTLNMIDLEVMVLDLRSEQLSILPFASLSQEDPYDSYEEDSETSPDYEAMAEDRIRFELIQMGRHLRNLQFQVACIETQIQQHEEYHPSDLPQSATLVNSGRLRVDEGTSVQFGNSTSLLWSDIEEMAVQALDLEVEISELRKILARQKKNSWELSQIAQNR